MTVFISELYAFIVIQDSGNSKLLDDGQVITEEVTQECCDKR